MGNKLFDNVDYLKCVIKQLLEDQFLQNWNSLVQNSPKAINYKTFKTEFKYEEFKYFRNKICNFALQI